MKMLFCSDVRLGAACTENMGVAYSRKWQAARTEWFRDLYDKAVREHASYVALFGHMFGQERVSEALIDVLFQTVGNEASIQTLAILEQQEYARISYRKDIPSNLHILCAEQNANYTDDHVALRIVDKETEIQLDECESFKIQHTPLDTWRLVGIKKGKYLFSFEPTGFEDAEANKYGYTVVEWQADTITAYQEIREQKYQYETATLKIEPTDDKKEIIRKTTVLIRNLKPETIMRVEIRGRAAFALSIPISEIREKLESRVLFARVVDDTIMDVNEAEFENDISLRSEFVRLALRDESLSETERNRLIRYGWNALCGKEVSVE